jgi:CDK5 regulatory subunit-associated protein 3
LKTTEKDSKNIFGSYSSQRMKDWSAVLKSYEKDNLYLAEAAQIYARNINYEIPSARKQMTMLEKLSSEALAKSQDAVKSENIIRNEYNLACQQLGIKGDKIKHELTEKLKDLPKLQTEVAQKVPQLKGAVNLYENFSGNKRCLPVTKHLVRSGNTTVYEYKYSEAPLKIEEPALPFKINDDDEDENLENNEIDFGQDIDFGDANEVNLEVGDIDWGADDDASVDPDHQVSIAKDLMTII